MAVAVWHWMDVTHGCVGDVDVEARSVVDRSVGLVHLQCQRRNTSCVRERGRWSIFLIFRVTGTYLSSIVFLPLLLPWLIRAPFEVIGLVNFKPQVEHVRAAPISFTKRTSSHSFHVAQVVNDTKPPHLVPSLLVTLVTMSRAIGGSPVFLLGALAGSAITSLFLNHKRRCDNSSTIGTSCQDTIEPSSNEQHPITSLPNNDSKSSSSKQHRRNSSHSSDNSPSRRSSFTDEDESLNTHKIGYAENPESGTNCQVISPSDWEKDEGVIRQAKNFEEQILSKLKSQGEMEMVLRRTRAVNALASQLTLAQDEKACFEVVSNLLVPLFRIDASAFLMTKVRNVEFDQ